MDFTVIDKDNFKIFSPIIFDAFTDDSKEVLRIGAVEDNNIIGTMSISYQTAMDTAILDSLYVLPEYRKKGKGKEMLNKAEELVKKHVNCLEAEYPESSKGLEALFKSGEYACIDGDPIYVYDIDKLLSNKKFTSLLKQEIKSVDTFTFKDLSGAQKKRMFELFREDGERNTEAGTRGLSEDLSVAVYDDNEYRIPKACLLATTFEDSITIAQLEGSGIDNPKYITAAIFAFANAVKEKKKETDYKELGMVAAHRGVKKVFELLFDGKIEPKESGLRHAIKVLNVG